LNVSALTLVGLDNIPPEKAKFTFAMARHAAIDLTQTFYLSPTPPAKDRLSGAAFNTLCMLLSDNGIPLKHKGPVAEKKFKELTGFL